MRYAAKNKKKKRGSAATPAIEHIADSGLSFESFLNYEFLYYQFGIYWEFYLQTFVIYTGSLRH